MSFLERYKSGQHKEVWGELVALEEKVFEPAHHGVAVAVAEETMQRVRQNLETIADRLTVMGFDFTKYPHGESLEYSVVGPLETPSEETEEQIETLKLIVGSLPISLEAFWRVVGIVDFVGYLPQWPENSDPIVVSSVEDSIIDYKTWDDMTSKEGEPFRAFIAPDLCHKDDKSGGMYYNIVLPNASADALLEDTPYDLMFVEYLRFALLEWGGFPGLKNSLKGEGIAQHLRSGLIPF